MGEQEGVGIVAAAVVFALAVAVQVGDASDVASERVAIAGIWLIGALALRVGMRLLGPMFAARGVRCWAQPPSWFPRARRILGSLTLVFALGLVATTAPSPEILPRVSGPVEGPGLVEGLVEAGSIPGPRCSVRASFGEAVWLLRVGSTFCPLARGDRIIVRAAELEAAPVTMPGATSAVEMATSQGVHRIADVALLWRRPQRGGGVMEEAIRTGSRAMSRLRDRAWSWSRGDDGRAFVVGASLGIGRALPPEQTRTLRAAGLSHLLAVSGLHVGFTFTIVFAALVSVFGGAGRRGVEVAAGLGTVALAGYVALTGFSPSVVRAAATRVVVVGCQVRGIHVHALQRLSWVVIAMLLVRPGWILAPGFQLSVAASFALSTMRRGESLLRSTIRITVFTAPLCWHHFGDAVFAGLVANLVAIPYFTWILAPMMVLGWILTPLAGLDALVPASLAAKLLLSAAEVCGRAPEVSWPILACGFAAMCVLERGIRRWRPAIPLVSLGLVLVPGAPEVGVDRGDVIVLSGARHRSMAGLSSRSLCVHELNFRVGQSTRVFERVAKSHGVAVHVAAGEGPHVEAFIRALHRANLSVTRVAACGSVEGRRIDEVMDRCAVRHGRVVVARVAPSGEAWCVADGRWISVLGP